MFKIYGGDTKFKQWTKNQKLIMSRLPLGAEVLFYNDPKEDEPLVTEVYEYTDENGISFHVCDVPNIFLTDTKRIKVRIPSKVVGLYGIVHSYVGQLERYFEVEPAEKPADYVYEETPTEGCGGHGGSASEDQIQADLSQTDSTQADYVKGVLRTEHLPKGYPYKGIGTILDGTFEFVDRNGIYLHQIIDEGFTIIDSKSYTVIWDGETYQCVATTVGNGLLALGNLAIAGAGADTGESFLFADRGDGQKLVGTNSTAATHTITIRREIVYPIASEFLPDEYVTETELASKGYLTSYTETDPTVPAWAKAETKPSYDFSELTVNDPEAAKTALAIEKGVILKNFQAAMPSTESWNSVTYGNGKFVAIVFSNFSTKAAYSVDGITWTAATMPSKASWNSVTYGNGKFVALANLSPTAAYSVDGITWTATTMPSTAKWWSISYGNGKFVATVSNSNTAAYSEDGITWSSSTMPISRYWRSVTYGNGKFVAIASSSADTAFSYDGITWKNTFEYLSQNESDITESVRSIINNETIAGVPACTTADNGKVLKVVDGVPAWVEA